MERDGTLERDADIDARRLAEVLRANPDARVNFSCFNSLEADAIAERLDPRQAARVAFSWRFTIGTPRVPLRRFVEKLQQPADAPEEGEKVGR